MMDYLRNKLKNSIGIKIFLGILTLSFGIWGVGDFIGTGGLDPSIALKIGKTQIRTDEFERRYNQELARFKQSMGPQATQEEAFRRQIMNALIQEMTRTAAINAVGRDMHVVIAPSELRDAIHAEKVFADQSGNFSQAQFQQVLASNNFTERSFVDMLEEDLRQQKLTQPVAVNVTVPKALTDAIFDYRIEARTADTLLVSSAYMPAPKAPSETEIKDTYEKNVASFTAPEYRKVTAVVLNAADLAKPEALSDAELKTYYDQNAGRYKTPAKRHIVQLLFDSEQKAQAVKDAAAPGDTLEALAAKTKSGSVIDLGDLTPDSPLAKTIAAAFVLPEHEISPPVQTDLGWHLFEVTSATPEAVQSFDEVKDKVRATMAGDKAVDAMYDASVQMEDQLAAGTALPEIAKAVNGKLVTIEAMDRDGRDPKGADAQGMVDRSNFLKAAFAAKAGADSGLKEQPDRKGYYILKVDSVTPPTPKPLAEVHDQVAAMWDKQARANSAGELAAKLLEQIKSGADMVKLDSGADKRVSYYDMPGITRFGDSMEGRVIDSQRISPEMLEHLFAAKKGEAFSAPVANGIVVARVKEIKSPQGNGDLAQVRTQINDSVKNAIGADLMAQMSQAFAGRFPVELNNTVIDDMVAKAR